MAAESSDLVLISILSDTVVLAAGFWSDDAVTQKRRVMNLGRRFLAEALDSPLLAATATGSGILAGRLAAGNDAVALLGNTAATGAMLFVLITALGAHFSPAVTLVMMLRGELRAGAAAAYALAQVGGRILGRGWRTSCSNCRPCSPQPTSAKSWRR